VEDETPTASAEQDGAPVEIDAAASTDSGAPATPPDGFIEQERYENARRELDRKNSLIDRALRGDAEAARELGFEYAEDDAVPDQEDEEQDGFRDPRLDALLQEREQERMQREQEEGWKRFNADLDGVAKGKNLTDRDRLLIYTETLQAGGTPEALQKAFGDFTAEREAYDKSVIERYLESKRAPHVSPGGTGATEEVLPLDATHDQRVAYMAQRMGLAAD
jgi:hypothetical protein